mgnify:CR=1 FL=1
MTLRVTILGCGSSAGVPRVGVGWGACDPSNPKNRRRRCSILLEKAGPDGAFTTHRLGNPLFQPGTVFQAVVPAGCWFAAERVAGAAGYALAGCTVAPGFEFSEFELADRDELARLASSHPRHAALITRLGKA